MNNKNYQILLGIILIAVYFIYFRGSEGMRYRPNRRRRLARERRARRARRARRQGGRKNPRSVSKTMQKLRRCRESLRAAKRQAQSGGGDAW
jgi:hypothetical protein